MLNRVILMGRITQELELKTTASGISVTSFSIAVDRNYVKQGDLVQVSANLAKETNYEEVIDDGLTLSAVIAAEVKDFP